MSEGQRPGRWFRLVYRSRKADRVHKVLVALRQAEVPLILEEEDREGVVHVLGADSSLRAGSLWSVFIPEHGYRVTRFGLRKLGFPITTDREGRGTRRSGGNEHVTVAIWLIVLLAASFALFLALQFWRGALEVDREEAIRWVVALGGIALLIGLPITLLGLDARRWVRSRRRRFVADSQG